MLKRDSSDGVEAMERGVVVLNAQDGIFPEGLIFEVQVDGIVSGFDPTRDEMIAAYRDARRNGYIVGAEDVAQSIIRRTMEVHEELVVEGIADVINDPSLDDVDFSAFKLLAAHSVRNTMGRR